MKPANRLRRSAEIGRVRTSGKSWAVGPVVLYAAPQAGEHGPVRAAFIAGKKIGGSVERNRAKRWMREAFRERIPYIQKGWDLLVIARPSIMEVDFERVRKSMLEVLKRGRLMAANEGPLPTTAAPDIREVGDENSRSVGHQDLPKDP